MRERGAQEEGVSHAGHTFFPSSLFCCLHTSCSLVLISQEYTSNKCKLSEREGRCVREEKKGVEKQQLYCLMIILAHSLAEGIIQYLSVYIDTTMML